MIKFEKLGLIYCPSRPFSWWESHAMAPAPIRLDDCIRVYCGAWDAGGISRIAAIDLDPADPLKILNIHPSPVLDKGLPGTFDENGVFPAHVQRVENSIMLYYTGFQIGQLVRYYNFGGLALGTPDQAGLKRVSEAPVLDRADEGLCVRAGQSVIYENGIFRSVYSAGTDWVMDCGKLRPCYDVFYQESENGISFSNSGTKVLAADRTVEHGLGRPQIFRHKNIYYIIFTRRLYSMKYFFGMARSSDLITWERIDNQIKGIDFSIGGWDSGMIYFPAILACDGRIYLFYSGNGFGKSGFGVATAEL